MKTALITGITGMDGSHLADFLLANDYRVVGLEHHRTIPAHQNIKHIADKITLIQGDLSDKGSLCKALEKSNPDEVYNFAAQSFVGTSWALAEHTSNITGLGVLRLLEAIKDFNPKIRFLQTSSSEMFGKTDNHIANELTVFHPRSPYGAAKAFGHYIVQNYRESYGLFSCSSICFNHESPRRGAQFVTKKIVKAMADIKRGKLDKVMLGNLDAKRDWGYAPEYVLGMWLMLQQTKPEDFVFATGETHSVEEFVKEAAAFIGESDYTKLIQLDPTMIRPAEVDFLLGDYSKAKTKLGWEPTIKFKELVQTMMTWELANE